MHISDHLCIIFLAVNNSMGHLSMKTVLQKQVTAYSLRHLRLYGHYISGLKIANKIQNLVTMIY
jgi:hypothetical protein